MSDEEKYQLVVLEGLLCEYGLQRFVSLLCECEETVCLDYTSDGDFLVFGFEKGRRHQVRTYKDLYRAIKEIISEISDSDYLEHELITKFNEHTGRGKAKGR